MEAKAEYLRRLKSRRLTNDQVAAAKVSPAGFAATIDSRYRRWQHIELLNQAITDTIAGRDGLFRLLVAMPPQHGKSETVSRYTPAWYLGRHPKRKLILTSYEAEYAESWGFKAREALREYGSEVFGVEVAKMPSSAHQWHIDRHGGEMRTAGARGPITGKGADLFIIDDPIKNAIDAMSTTLREQTWDWYRSTVLTRLQEGAALILVQTRWHEDDLAGRVLKSEGEKWRVLSLPALAEQNDALGREIGEPLCPERYSREWLEAARADVGSYWWSAMYQQRPSPEGGGFFKRQWFEIVDAAPANGQLVRFWDKAGSDQKSKKGDSSAGCLMLASGGKYFILHMEHGRWSPLERNQVIEQTAELDELKYGRHRVQLWIEQEPGNGGKESADISAIQLAKYGPRFDKPTTAKDLRARPFAAQCEAGNVKLVKPADRHWNVEGYIDELLAFPVGDHDDRVDASSGAFNKLVLMPPPREVAQPVSVGRSRILAGLRGRR